ncbi:MAG: RagB/SusD family nutrient uptake outer membrane protein [Tannerellaceae bacterium]|jgi:tetratricopeptide (TPR) repeat protein|nr:RagB/SusD family nutrient uptake outer membrane protein [Tannerellaceae bacterium]
MKTKNILLLFTIVLLSACSDFLDKNPLVNSAAETYYSNVNEANDAIIGCYAISQSETFQLGPFMLIGDGCSDDTDLGNSHSEAFSWLGSVAQAMQSFDVQPNNWVSNQLWQQGFTGINRSTQAIERIKDNEAIPENKRNQFVGEGHFLRAFYYFFMARQYGRLPIVDHILTYDEYYSPRATMEDTWAHIESDLKRAVELLPEKSQYDGQDMGRATKGAANALLGKAFIHQSKFQEAYDVLMKVVNSGEYGLETKYEDTFTLEHENGIESIYEIQHSISGTGWADDNEGSILSFYEHDADPDDPIKWHNGWSMHCPTWDLANTYEPGDPRKVATIIFEGDFYDGRIHKNIASSTGLQPKKWYIPYEQRSQIDQSDCPKNIIFIRYADILLYLAEAANELGKTSEALNFLEQVRARARASSEDSTVLPRVTETGKDALRRLIWHERRVELACEGQRFWDLVRQGRAGEVMRAYSTKHNSLKGRNFVDGKSELQPVPLAQITISNGTMEQNPGY